MKKSLLKVSCLSVLAILCTANAWAVPADYMVYGGTYFKSETDFTFVDSFTIEGDVCLSGYYCPEGSVDVYISGVNGDRIFGVDSFPYNLVPCPDGTTSDAGADSIDDCYPIESPTPSRTPRRIAKDETSPECDDTTLGTASGSTDFEADWTANTINITWVGNGATVSDGASTCTYDQSFTLPTAPTKTGYNFAGWKVVSQ